MVQRLSPKRSMLGPIAMGSSWHLVGPGRQPITPTSRHSTTAYVPNVWISTGFSRSKKPEKRSKNGGETTTPHDRLRPEATRHQTPSEPPGQNNKQAKKLANIWAGPVSGVRSKGPCFVVGAGAKSGASQPRSRPTDVAPVQWTPVHLGGESPEEVFPGRKVDHPIHRNFGPRPSGLHAPVGSRTPRSPANWG
jgi:hypothetical protein